MVYKLKKYSHLVLQYQEYFSVDIDTFYTVFRIKLNNV